MMQESFKIPPNVAVCLAAYNGMRWLPEQMDSILAQTGVLVTVFVSVDCSSDGTEEWINQRAVGESRIVVLPHGEHSGGPAQNFFRLLREVDFSSFDYISFSDQDDIWLTNKLFRAHEVLLETRADAYSSNVLAFWPSGRKSLIKKSQPQKRWDFLFEGGGPGCTYVMKIALARALQSLLRERWREVREVWMHDWFSYAFARANGYHWIIDEYAGMLYRQHEENQVGVNAGLWAFVHRACKVLSGWGLIQAALIAQLVGLDNDPFVKRWISGGRGGLFWLSLHAGQCRRRVRDKVVFAFACMALCVVGSCGR